MRFLPIVELVLLEIGEHQDDELVEDVGCLQGLPAFDGFPEPAAFNLVQVLDLVEGLEGFEGVEDDDRPSGWEGVPEKRADFGRLKRQWQWLQQISKANASNSRGRGFKSCQVLGCLLFLFFIYAA